MKYLNHLFIVFFLFSAETIISQDSVSFPVKLDATGFQEVFAEVDNLYISGQPEKESFAKLKSEGVTTIEGARPTSAMEEAQRFAESGDINGEKNRSIVVIRCIRILAGSDCHY